MLLPGSVQAQERQADETNALALVQQRARPPRPRGQPTTAPATAPSPSTSLSPTTQPAAVAPEVPPSEPPAPREEFEPFGYAGPSPLTAPGGVQSDFLPLPDRWRIGLPPDYIQNVRGRPLDPYNLNVLKGDYPILGQDKFFIATLTSDTLFEARRLPVPSGVSALRPDSIEFFGQGDQLFANQNFILTLELFKGDTVYRPRDWEFRFTPVFSGNYLYARELQLTDVDVRRGRHRTDDRIAIQELFFEQHLGDLSPNYDFWSVRGGIQGFTSDFRGFLFSDNEPGIRLFGTFDNNKLQWNLAWFHQLEKDTNTGLNTLEARDQDVFVANVYRQDFLELFGFRHRPDLRLGYTAQLSFHANLDSSSDEIEIDDNGFIVRPAPIGTIGPNDVRAYYLGWAGDGHIGRINLSHQFYQAFGEESANPIAGREVSINSQFFAAEVSYDQDWVRYRASFAYASGDSDPTDGKATGFDSIFDNPNFAGGGFSYFTRQALRLTGSGTNLINRNSFFPDLRTSKEQGQANFVNPGLFLYNVGLDVELTPKTKAIFNVTYLRFADTETIQLLLHDNKIGRDIGIDTSIGIQHRPFLNNNAIFTIGAAAFTPMNGFDDIYTSETLYSVFTAFTFTY